MQILRVTQSDGTPRLDKYLKRHLPSASSGFLYKMLRKKNIVLNEKKASGKELLSPGDEIKLYFSDETVAKFSTIATLQKEQEYPFVPLDVLYEDPHIMFLNKPAGMLSQKATSEDLSINEYVIGYLLHNETFTKEEIERNKPSICNRLDRNTSGLITVGKTIHGLQMLSEVFREHQLEKYYLALVWGQMKQGGHEKGYLKKNAANNRVSLTTKETDGDYIETIYEPLVTGQRMTLIKVQLLTGKSHQIRLHLASVGFPLAGDTKYGDYACNQYIKQNYHIKHHLLHAYRLVFPPDTLASVEENKDASWCVAAPLPKQFEKVLTGEGLKHEI